MVVGCRDLGGGWALARTFHFPRYVAGMLLHAPHYPPMKLVLEKPALACRSREGADRAKLQLDQARRRL
jgi:hypothetical protein